VWVINSTNINKINDHLSSLLNSLITKKTRTNDVGNPGPGLGQAQKCDGVKPGSYLQELKSQGISFA